MVRPVVVLVLASGAAWESEALRRLNDERSIVVLRRCVDVADLLAAASAGQADVALVGLESPGLDRAATDHLLHHAVRPVVVLPADDDAARLRASRIGIAAWVPVHDLAALTATVAGAATEVMGVSTSTPAELRRAPDQPDQRPGPTGSSGRLIAVWGPTGAPGRTTLAGALAAGLAARARPTLLVDADPYGGSVAQQLGILDEVSGLLSAARLAATGDLADGFGSVPRALDAHLGVVTGLPRADRWVEVRAGALESLLELGVARGDVVVDTGFSLEEDPSTELTGRPGRNHLTLATLALADELVVVGSADPVGLARLARGLVEVRPLVEERPVRVVVNRMRPTLGWSEKEIAAMVTGFLPALDVHFLPDDRATLDRALLAGSTLVEQGDSAYLRGLAGLLDALAPQPRPARRPGAGSGGEEQVQPARGERDHREEQRELPDSWCRRGRIWIARSWAATTPTRWPTTTAITFVLASSVGW